MVQQGLSDSVCDGEHSGVGLVDISEILAMQGDCLRHPGWNLTQFATNGGKTPASTAVVTPSSVS